MAGADSLLHAAFTSPSDVRNALAQLAEAGIAASDIEVRSSVPLEDDLRPVGLELRTRAHYMAVLGGLLGGTAAFLLTSLTSRAYPLPTGGMPIVPPLTTAVITFEGVAIGALMCTVATVLYECRLPRLRNRPGPLDRHLAEGSIILVVRSNDVASQEWASNALATEVQELAAASTPSRSAS